MLYPRELDTSNTAHRFHPTRPAPSPPQHPHHNRASSGVVPPLLRSSSHEVASNSNMHSQTGVSMLKTTPAESLLRPQSVDGDADSQSFQANEDTVSRSFGLSGKSFKTCQRKALLVGDWACGKSSLLSVLTKGTFPEYHFDDEIFQTFVTNIEIDDTLTELALWDTPCEEGCDRLRPLAYPDAHVLLICFSIDNPDSLDHIYEQWFPEVLHFCAGISIALVGTKSDLRHDGATIAELHKSSQHLVTPEEAQHARIKIGAKAYMECSAKLNVGVAGVFEAATRCALQPKPVKAKRRKSLLRLLGMARE
jgi:Ras family protein A